jgi:hypothetical protein
MAIIPQKPVCLSYEDNVETYRSSNEGYCFKISRILDQGPHFPCQRNEENPISKGCHVKSRNDPENALVEIKEDDFIINGEVLRILREVDRWNFLGKEGNFLKLQKKLNHLNADEWCFSYCTHPIKIAYLSPSQLKTYELLRGNKIVDDIKAFSEIDAEYFKELLTKSDYPKLAIVLEIAKKV